MSTPNTPAHTPISTLYVADKRGPNAMFAVEAESNIEGIKVPIALCPYKPHAELICAAVNSHAKLREALTDLLAAFVTKAAYPEYRGGGTNDEFIRLATVETRARAALKESEAK